jgi:hypothetical protein
MEISPLAVVIVIAQNVSRSLVPSGLQNEHPKFSKHSIFMSSSPFPNRSLLSLTRTKVSSTAFYSGQLPRPCSPLLLILTYIIREE